MKIKYSILLFYIMLVAGKSGAADTLPPQISVDKEKVDFGSYEARLPKEAIYTITNKGVSLLKLVKIRNNCSCAVNKVDKADLNPGESTKFSVTVKGDSIYGQYSKNAYIETNDPNQKITTLNFSGTAVPILSISPKSMVYAGVLQKGGEFKEKFMLEADNDKVEIGDPVVDCAYPAKVVMKKESQKSYSLEVSIKTETPGILKCKISIPVKSPEGWKAPEILVIGDVGRKLIAIPSSLVLPKNMAQTVERQISIKLLGDKITDEMIKKITWDAPNGISIGPGMEKDSLVEYKLTLSPEFMESAAKTGNQTLKASIPDAEPAVITISPPEN